MTEAKQGMCILDVFTATIHQAKTGEQTTRWQWTKKRKTTKV